MMNEMTEWKLVPVDHSEDDLREQLRMLFDTDPDEAIELWASDWRRLRNFETAAPQPPDDPRITELEAEVSVLTGLLTAASCPNCGGQGWYPTFDGEGNELSQEQCQWCFERDAALAAPQPPVDPRIAELEAEVARLKAKPTWKTCDIHGDGNAFTWGCPECVRELRKEVARLDGSTVNGRSPETWPPNRRTPDDSNEKAIALMRQHVASYSSIDAHRHNCLDLCCRLETAEAKLAAIGEEEMVERHFIADELEAKLK